MAKAERKDKLNVLRRKAEEDSCPSDPLSGERKKNAMKHSTTGNHATCACEDVSEV